MNARTVAGRFSFNSQAAAFGSLLNPHIIDFLSPPNEGSRR
jgi:hypothetical protein